MGGTFRDSSFRYVATVRLSSASGHANNNEQVLRTLIFYKLFKNVNDIFYQHNDKKYAQNEAQMYGIVLARMLPTSGCV